MKMIQTPVKGMQDFLPEDMALRQHVLGVIRDTYGRYGFTEIGTPAMEHIGNLTGKNGGENEKLIFKVEKRGRDLEKSLRKIREDETLGPEEAGTELSDSALRYDLTVPLCRYYSCHKNELPTPFKALQIGDASKVVPVDKLSVVITILLAFLFLHEQFTVKSLLGCILIGAGTLMMVL